MNILLPATRYGIIPAKPQPSGPFDPMTLSPAGWWDSDPATYFDATSGGSLVTAENAMVKRWEDKSGNGWHATDSTGVRLHRKAYNGRPALFFNNSYLQVAGFQINLAEYTAVTVHRQLSQVDYAGVMVIGASGGGDDAGSGTKARFGANTPGFPAGGGYGVVCSANPQQHFDGAWRDFYCMITTCSNTEGKTRVYNEGNEMLGRTNPNSYSRSSVLSDAGLLFGALYIGGVIQSSYRLFGHIVEIMLIPRVITADERADLVAYHAAKYRPTPQLLDLSGYTSAFVTHRGDGVPLNVYSDTGGTVPAKVGERVYSWRSSAPDALLVTAVASQAPRLRYFDGAPVVDFQGDGQNNSSAATGEARLENSSTAWTLTEVAAAWNCQWWYSETEWTVWDAGSNVDDCEVYSGAAYLGRFRSTRADSMFSGEGSSLSPDAFTQRTNLLISNASTYAAHRWPAIARGTAAAGFTNATTKITIGTNNGNTNSGRAFSGHMTALILEPDTSKAQSLVRKTRQLVGRIPASVAALKPAFWFDADAAGSMLDGSGNPVTTDGASVSRMVDLSGNNLHLFSQRTAPVLKTALYNGRNAIRFGSSRMSESSPTLELNQDLFTVAMVHRETSSVNNCGLITMPRFAGGGNDYDDGLAMNGEVSGYSFGMCAGGQNRILPGTKVPANLLVSVSRVNHYEMDLISSQNVLYTTKSRSGYVAKGLNLGERYVGGNWTNAYFFTGDFAEILIFEGCLSNSEMAWVYDYLFSKWR